MPQIVDLLIVLLLILVVAIVISYRSKKKKKFEEYWKRTDSYTDSGSGYKKEESYFDRGSFSEAKIEDDRKADKSSVKYGRGFGSDYAQSEAPLPPRKTKDAEEFYRYHSTERMRTCAFCGVENEPEETVCSLCGLPLRRAAR